MGLMGSTSTALPRWVLSSPRMLYRLLPRRVDSSSLCPGVVAQAEFESDSPKQCMIHELQALSSRRFELGFNVVNLHRLTQGWAGPAETHPRRSRVARRGS